MDKFTEAENTRKIFISGFLSFQVPYFSKRLILDKEKLIFDKEVEILSLRLRDFLSSNQEEIREPLSINQEDCPRGEGQQFQLRVLSSSFSPSFTDLIIGEAPHHHQIALLKVHITLLMPRGSDDQGNNNWHRLWESNRKSHLQDVRA